MDVKWCFNYAFPSILSQYCSNLVLTKSDNVDWKLMYFTLQKHYPMKEQYGDTLHFCKHCSILFWKVNKHTWNHIYVIWQVGIVPTTEGILQTVHNIACISVLSTSITDLSDLNHLSVLYTIIRLHPHSYCVVFKSKIISKQQAYHISIKSVPVHIVFPWWKGQNILYHLLHLRDTLV